VCRNRKAAVGEADAVRISELLPFLEYDLQRQIVLKLKIHGMNAAFGYQCKIQVGNDLIIATALCTGFHLVSLPPPPTVQLVRNRDGRTEQDNRLQQLQESIDELNAICRRAFSSSVNIVEHSGKAIASSSTERQLKQSTVKFSSSDNNRRPSADGSVEIDAVEVNGKLARSRSLSVASDGESSSSSSSSSTSSTSSSSSSSSSSSEDWGNDISSLESPESSSSESSKSSSDSDSKESNNRSHRSHRSQKSKDEVATVVDSPIDHENKKNSRRGSRARSVSTSSSKKSDSAENTHSNPPAVSASKPKHPQQKGLKPKWDSQLRRNTNFNAKKKRLLFKDDRPPLVFEIDEETDADIISGLSAWIPPEGFDFATVEVKFPCLMALILSGYSF
jgi:hypothetical protein